MNGLNAQKVLAAILDMGMILSSVILGAAGILLALMVFAAPILTVVYGATPAVRILAVLLFPLALVTSTFLATAGMIHLTSRWKKAPGVHE